jgi:hypothetical protein
VIVLVLSLALVAAAASAAPEPRTLRVGYVHMGNSREERFALDRVVLEGPWPGNPRKPIDDTGLGAYGVTVTDVASGKIVYSRGFSSIFAEWETTDEAKQVDRAFHESVRFPEPSAAVTVALTKRRGGVMQPLWSVKVDPKDPAIERAAPSGRAWAVMENGPPRDKVDLLLMGDGYTAAEMDKWHADAKRLAELLFAESPFKERRQDFNVWAVDTPSSESGVARPSDAVWRRSALGATYDAFGSERYVLTMDDERLREAAAAAPYEFMEIVVNDRKYGGGGIFNLYATVSADNAFTPYVFVHEFGHHFAGLADEYYTSAAATENPAAHPEPWEPNVTVDPQASKWKTLVRPGTPLPTPWSKTEFEALERDIQARRRAIRAAHRPEDEMEALFREERSKVEPLLAAGPHGRAVGAYEGAMYESRGYYRPQADCIMFTRDPVGFCAVCARAIARIVDLYTR